MASEDLWNLFCARWSGLPQIRDTGMHSDCQTSWLRLTTSAFSCWPVRTGLMAEARFEPGTSWVAVQSASRCATPAVFSLPTAGPPSRWERLTKGLWKLHFEGWGGQVYATVALDLSKLRKEYYLLYWEQRRIMGYLCIAILWVGKMWLCLYKKCLKTPPHHTLRTNF